MYAGQSASLIGRPWSSIVTPLSVGAVSVSLLKARFVLLEVRYAVFRIAGLEFLSWDSGDRDQDEGREGSSCLTFFTLLSCACTA